MSPKPPQPPVAPTPADDEWVWQTPLGLMRASISDRGVCCLKFPDPQELRLPTLDAHSEPVRQAGEPCHGAASRLCQALAEELTLFLTQYFAGDPVGAPPGLDWARCGELDKAVWQATGKIAFGQTATYGEIARQIGRPAAARAVGGALGRNPMPLLVPCHRVLSTASGQRRWGGFSAGVSLKKWLLQHERRMGTYF